MGLKKTLLDNYYKCDECGCFFLAQVGEDMLIHDESSILDCPYCSNVREKTKEIEELKKDAMTLHTRINSEIDENGENAGSLVELQKEHEELQKALACVEGRYRNRGEMIEKQAVINEMLGEELYRVVTEIEKRDKATVLCAPEKAKSLLVRYLRDGEECMGCSGNNVGDVCDLCKIISPEASEVDRYTLSAKYEEFLQELFEADRGTLLESTVEDFEYDKTHALADKVEELNNRLKMLERPGGCDALDIANESTEKIQALDSHVDDLRKEMNFLAIDAETFRNSIVSLQKSNEALATLPPVDIGARKQHRHTRDALQGLLIVLKEGFLRSPRTRESKMAHDIQAALQTLIAQEKGEQS